MQFVAEAQQQPFFAAPAWVFGAAVHQGMKLFGSEPDAPPEKGDMDAPLVLGAAERRRPIYDDFPLPQRQVPAIKQPAREEPKEEPFVARERREQNEGGSALWHYPVEPLLHFLRKRRLGRRNPCRHR